MFQHISVYFLATMTGTIILGAIFHANDIVHGLFVGMILDHSGNASQESKGREKRYNK